MRIPTRLAGRRREEPQIPAVRRQQSETARRVAAREAARVLPREVAVPARRAVLRGAVPAPAPVWVVAEPEWARAEPEAEADARPARAPVSPVLSSLTAASCLLQAVGSPMVRSPDRKASLHQEAGAYRRSSPRSAEPEQEPRRLRRDRG
jgi:hypothetical protein